MGNLPVEYKKGLFGRIKDFFIRIFGKKVDYSKQENIDKINTIDNKKEVFDNELQKGIKEKNTKNYIMKQVKENPEVLEKLSIKRLLELKTLYDEKLTENNKKIENLKNEINNLQKQIKANS